MFLLVPAYPGSHGQKAVKRLCVCVLQCSIRPNSNTIETLTSSDRVINVICGHVFSSFHSMNMSQLFYLHIVLTFI